MRIYRKALKGESGNQRRPAAVTMQVMIGADSLDRIRELAEREGTTAASMARQLIDEALHARELDERRPDAEMRPPLASRRDGGRRMPAEESRTARPRATAGRRDII
jgi:hypothetical protein